MRDGGSLRYMFDLLFLSAVVDVKYSPFDSDCLSSWAEAARLGGTTPSDPAPGVPRTYNVEAWLDMDDNPPIKVTDTWLSELPEVCRKPLLKELGLPVKKAIVYKESDGTVLPITDIKIVDVWNDWFSIVVRLKDGSVPPVRIHSMYLAEMNSGAASTDTQLTAHDKPPRKRAVRSKKKSSEVEGMPLDFFVIDLESTDRGCKTSEICEIAALKVVDGKVIDEFETLVYIDGEISADAARVNHISKDMLQDAPHMTAALTAFFDFIGSDSVLVGHNIKTFDLPFVDRVAKLCGIEFEYQDAVDTYTLAKRAWPDLPSYKMDNLRTCLDLDMEGCHRALKDCFDEYALYMRIRKDVAEGNASVAPPKKSASRPGTKWSGKWGRKKAKDFTTEKDKFDERHPLFDKSVVLSGIEGDEYDEYLQAVCDLGGHPQDNVTKKTNYLVIGDSPGRAKVAKAQEYGDKGIPIEIIGEHAFLELVNQMGE